MTGLPTIQPAKTAEYETPKDLFDQWWKEVGGFTFDPFCRPHHHSAIRVIRNKGTICVPPGVFESGGKHIKIDGYAHPWHGKVWMNPEYGPSLRRSIPKAVSEVECGNAELVMALLPAKTEVRWFQDYIIRSVKTRRSGRSYHVVVDQHPLVAEVRFLRGRIQFGGGEASARVGNVLVVWKK